MGFPDSSAGKESACNAGDPGSIPGSRRSPGEDRLLTPVFWGFPGGSAGKESTCNAGDLDSIPGLGRSPGEGKGYPPQHSGLENSKDYIVHGVSKSQTQLSDFHFHFLLGLTRLITLQSKGFSRVCSNAGEGVEKREPSCTVGGNANQYNHYGEQCGDSLKNWK